MTVTNLVSDQSIADLADMQPGFISLLNRDGEIVFINLAYSSWLGIERGDLIGKRIVDIVCGMVWPEETGERNVEIKHPDGTQRRVEVRTSPHANGTHFFQFVSDNTAEEALRHRGWVIDTIFSLTNEVFVVLDADGNFLDVSPAFERITGVAASDAIGKNVSCFQHPDDHQKSLEIRERVVAGESVVGYENRYMTQNGGFRWIRWTAVPNIEKVFCIGRDVTEDKAREEAYRQTQKMEAIGQLTGGIAHDFNNLLMAISGSLELVAKKLPAIHDPKIDTFMEGAQSSAKRAAALTHRLLAFSRRQSLAPAVVDVNALVGGMRDMIERTIGSGVEIIDQRAEGTWSTYCDAHQLENGLLNLCLNARDAMPAGGTIIIRTMNVTPEMCFSRGL